MVELFSKGNLEELRVPSLFHAWLYASQLSSALEYLESKHLVHTSVVEPFVYIASLEKVRVFRNGFEYSPFSCSPFGWKHDGIMVSVFTFGLSGQG